MFDDLIFLLEDLPSSVSGFVSSGITYFLVLLVGAHLSKFLFAYLGMSLRKVVAYVRNPRTYCDNRNSRTD